MNARRKFFLTFFLLTGILSLFAGQPSSVFAEVRQWDFQEPDDYRFESGKVSVRDGKAHLIEADAFEEKKSEDFDRGTYDKFLWAARGAVELIPQTVYPAQAPGLARPLSGRENGLAALWHLDEPSGTNLIDAVARNVAKASDAEVVSGQTGLGHARLFDGAMSHVFIPHYRGLEMDGPFTVELWFRPAAVNGKPQTLISRWQSAGAGKSFMLQITPEGRLDFQVSPDGAVTVHQPGDTVLTQGHWYHAAAIYTGEELRLYLNGVLDSRPVRFGGPVHAGTHPIYLGATVSARLEDFFEGVIDEAAIYRRALAPAEILTHFGNPQGLTGLWHLNERGSAAADDSGYGHTAQPSGEPEYQAEGRLGTGIEFNGKDQYLETAPSFALAADDSITLEAWVKPKRLPGLGEAATVLAIAGDASEFTLSLAGPDGRVRAAASPLTPAEAVSTAALMPEVWQHVAASWDNREVRLYVNGLLDTVVPVTGTRHLEKSAVFIGTDRKKGAFFRGTLDEAAVYRRVRTADEIAESAGLFPRAGVYQSSIKDAGSASPWRRLEWSEALPYGEELDARAAGLLHLYHLNEEDGSLMADAKGENGLSPVGTYAVPGVFSSARWFQAKGFDKILTQRDMPALSTFTISAWFQFAGAAPGASDRLLSIGDENPAIWRGQDGRMHVSMLGMRGITGTRSVADTRWHHVTLTADGRDIFLYIDGELDGSSPLFGASASAPLVLGNLKTTDTFQGALEEVAFFNYPLSRQEIVQHYLQGRLDLKFLVRTAETEDFSQSFWRGPQGTNLMETIPDTYTGGLWHFNEEKFSAGPGSASDSGRFSNHAAVYGRAGSAAGVLGGAAILNGTDDYFEIPDAESLRPVTALTLSAWIHPPDVRQTGGVIADKRYLRGAPTFSSYAMELTAGNRLAFRLGHSGGYHTVETERAGEIAAGRWNHVAAVFTGREIRLYINGRLRKVSAFEGTPVYDEGPLYLGRYGSGADRFFAGMLDEVVLESRELSDEEMTLRFQSANPDNFYRSAPVTLDLPAARYFQYRAHFFTALAAASPLLEETQVRANTYLADKPSISNGIGVSYADITRFSERLAPEHKGAVTYQISNDGANWFYHNGRRWVIAGNVAESNTAAQLESRIRDVPKDIGIGSFYFRAFLHSPTGAEQAALDSVEIEYLPNRLTLTAPNGGETLLVGSEQVIRWNSIGDLAKVNLEYSRDDFRKDFHSIARDVPNTGSYNWKIPDEPFPSVRIRVMDALDPRIHDGSDIGFRIAGAFELTAPNWNERWEAGSIQKIQWRTLGSIPQVRLEYSADEFGHEIYSIVDSLKNDGHYEWKVPDHISNSVRVRISDVRDPAVADTSNDRFAITGAVKVLAPQAHARLIVGSRQEIRWHATGTIPAVRVEYRTGDAEEWITITDSAVNRGALEWEVPDVINSAVRLRVSDVRDPAVAADSEPFAIIGGLRLVHPQGSLHWSVGSRRKIVWETIGTIPAVNIEYSVSAPGAEAGWLPVEMSLANTGQFVWQVPDQISESAAIRVSDARDPFIQTVNAEPIKIVPGFVLRAPNGGESLKIGSEFNILWNTHGTVPQVKLEYSRDHFASDAKEIIAAASNIGQFAWKIPDEPAKEIWVRISDVKNADAADISDAPFRIFGGFKILRPAGGEKLQVGSLATLEWETLGSLPKVRLDYSRDDFVKDVRVITKEAPNTGRYTWNVPDDIGTGFTLRVSDSSDPHAHQMSDGAFVVVGDFHLLTPQGGEDLIVGTEVPIKWKASGSVPAVRIDYSEDNFEKSFNTLTDAAPNTGTFQWMVPNRVGKQFKLRIWDPSDPETMDVMAEPSRITGGFRLKAPNGGEVLYVGETAEIKWDIYGTIPRVRIEFSDDNFNRNVWEISDAHENGGSYRWQIPDTASGLYRVRISDPRDVTAYDISNADFRIRSRFVLESPNGGEGWRVGEKRTIRWRTSGTVAAVKLEYSTDEGQMRTIADAAPNSGTYEWTVPDHVAGTVHVRVSDAKDSQSADLSDSAFRILGILDLQSPDAGEVWHVGEQHEIRWQTTGAVKAVRLDYSRDGFASEAQPIVESIPNTGTYNWTIPDSVGPNTRVRVMDTADHEVQDMSAKPFQIAAAFMMMGPAGGEVWHASEKREINWVTVGTAPEVILELSSDDFQTEPILIDRGVLNTGRYLWDIPKLLGENYKIRVCDMQAPAICDAGDLPFSLRTPLEIVFPQGGESWPVGSDQEIRWNTYGRVDRVAVEYSADEQHLIWEKLFEELPNEGRLLFAVPDHVSKSVLFRVSDYEDVTLYDVTEKPVTFAGTLTLLEPNGGQKWAAGTKQNLTWDTLGTVSNVRLEFSRDDFRQDIQLIESSLPNGGTYEWRVPAVQGVTAKVRVSDAANADAADISDGPFKIMAGFTLITPDGGEKWTVGEKAVVRWKTEGDAPLVRLDYRVGDEWKVIAEKAPNGGEYDWVVPNDSHKAVFLRVADAADPDASDSSDEGFEIRPGLLVTHPNGGEVFPIGLPSEIRWVSIGTVGQVKLEYSKDGFAQDVRVIAEQVEDTGSYFWAPSDDVTAGARVRVTMTDNAEVTDAGDQPFQIVPSLRLLEPAGGEKWVVDSSREVRWDWRGTLDRVKLEYSVNDFKTASIIAEDILNTGRYEWKIPNAVSGAVRVRVSDALHPAAVIVSENTFKIIPGFRLLSPNGGELWKAGEKQDIRWETAGTSSRVRLEYGLSGPNGTDWKPVAKALPNTGRYEWEIPADISSQVLVRVVDGLDADALDASDEMFKILARFNILSPVPGDLLTVDGRHQIRWSTQGQVPSVRMDYAAVREADAEGAVPPASAFQPLEPLWANTGSYYWTVPDTIAEQIWLRISDAAEPDAYTLLSGPFKIRGRLTWELPAGKNLWPIASQQTLRWQTTGSISNVRLEYSTDGGKVWKEIAGSLPNAGSYGWTIPDDAALNVQLRISDAANAGVADLSAVPIALVPQFEMLVPAAGETWIVDSARVVEWKTTGRAAKIWLEFSRGGEWEPLAGPMPDQGRYEWKVPDAIAAAARIRVRDGDNAEAQSVSGSFRIAGSLNLARPAGAEIWKTGETEKIRWTTVGTIPQVRIEALWDLPEPGSLLIADALKNKGEFEWRVPDQISDHLKIRVSDMRDAEVKSVSPQNFSVIAAFSVSSPKGAEIWTVGEAREINWASSGTVPSVNLEYSRDDFYHDINVIAANVPNTGAAVWTVPDSISDSVRVRVSDARDPRAFAISPAVFKVRGALAFDLPAAGESWVVGTNKEIRWQTTGSIPFVRLEYSRDDFRKDVQVIENQLANQGFYEWPVADVISRTLKLRVAAAADASVAAVSEPVKIRGAFTLKAPAGGEKLRVLEESSILWETTGSIPRVRLEYSRDDFQRDVQVITADTPNKGQWSWVVPDAIGAGVKVRILDATDHSVTASNSEPFQIQGVLALNGPAAGMDWPVGSEQEIVWTTVGTVPFVRVEYSKDDFQRHAEVIADNLENRGRMIWVVPDDIAERVRLRVSDVRNAETAALSEFPARIHGVLDLQEPSEPWVAAVGSELPLAWLTQGTVPMVRLEYSTADAPESPEDWKLIAGSVENSGAYPWQLPDDISNQVRVRVSDARDLSVRDTLTKPFSITGSFKLLGPQGGERWIAGTAHDLTWESLGSIREVRLEYSRDQFVKDMNLIEAQVPNTGRYLWTVPDAIASGVQVRILDAADERVSAVSSGSFSIVGDFILTQPVSGTVWQVGRTEKITWQTLGSISFVRLEYVVPGLPDAAEPRYEIIQDRIPNQNSFSWQLPGSLPRALRLRIVNSDDPAVFAEAAEVRVLGSLAVLQPAESQRWLVGSEQEIVWRTEGNVPKVQLEYSRDGFTGDTGVIAPPMENTGSFRWVVPDIPAEQLSIRVSDADQAAVAAVSPAPVRVSSYLNLTAPSGGEIWEVGSRQELLWETVGTLPKVRLEYSHDKFEKHASLIAEIENSGRFTWQVPDDIGEHVWVRISDVADGEVFDVSPASLALRGALFLKSPQGGEIWNVGDEAGILWDTVGSVPRVRVEYSTDDFASAVRIADGVENKGRFTWLVPDVLSDRLRIRVSDVRNARVFAFNAMPLKIRGVLRFTSPLETELWTAGTQHPVLWETRGSIAKVHLEYSTDNFQTALPVASDLPNQGRHTWTVPDLSAEHVLLRVSDAADQATYAVLASPLRIGGAIAVLSPSGGESLAVGEEALIRWQNTGTIPNVRLEASADRFQKDIRMIEASIPNQQEYKWRVPDWIQPALEVRVSDVRNLQIAGVSPLPFKITGRIEMAETEPGTTWPVGSRQKISWKTAGSVPAVQLEYSTDNFVTAAPLALALRNQDHYEWDVPDLAGREVRLKISDTRDPSVYSMSQVPVPVQGRLALTEPKGGEVWISGERYPIAWKTTGTVPNINLEYSTDEFTTSIPIATAVSNTGSYLWTAPDVRADSLRVRVSAGGDGGVIATSPAVEVRGSLALTSPAGGEVWFAGLEHPILWQTRGLVEKVRIEYSTDNFRTVSPVAMEVPNSGKFLWKLPEDVTKQARVRITDAANAAVSAESAKPFEIRGMLTLLSPVGGEIWNVGERHPISWQTRGTIGQIRIEYSTDDFVSDSQIIVSAMANKGVFYWEVPAIAAGQARIRISDAADARIFDMSRAPLKVAGSLELTYPGSGEIFRAGDQVDIRWRSTPNVQNVKLEYSTDDFQNRTLISDYAPNSGTFLWTVPEQLNENMRIRVSDAANQLVYSFSRVPFAVRGALDFVSPAGAKTSWRIGSEQKIAWTTRGPISSIRLEYSSDDFQTSLPVVMSMANTGSYNWTVPDITKSAVRFRISDALQPAVFAVSDPVELAGSLDILSPSAGSRWIVNEERIIRWRSSGLISKVDLEYSKDNFDQDTHLIIANTANLGSYSWRVPNDRAAGIRVRVRASGAAGQVLAVSEPFQIDLNHVRWIVRDAETGDHLTGLELTDSTGHTRSGLASPLTLDYPYGIYTTVWTKPAYGEFRSTWLADKDQSFTVQLEPRPSGPVEMPRVNFEYDRSRDLMNVTCWFEKDGKPAAAVIHAEVKIYEGRDLIKTLISSTPDSKGIFRMVWDTSQVSGNTRYLASSSITTSAGQVLAGPISYQLDLPVKEARAAVAPRTVPSAFLRPVGSPLTPTLSQGERGIEGETAADTQISSPAGRGQGEGTETTISTASVSEPAAEVREARLTVPAAVLMNETVSISYTGSVDAEPVVDLYNADKKLVLRSQPMTRSAAGQYVYLLPVRGLGIIPGKSLTVFVIDRKTGRFQSAPMLVQAAPAALGLDQAAGAGTVLDVLGEMDGLVQEMIKAAESRQNLGPLLARVEDRLVSFAGMLTQESVNPAVTVKLNRLAQAFSELAGSKGYATEFLVKQPLSEQAGLTEVTAKINDLRRAIGMLERLYRYTAGPSSASR